MIFIKNEIGNFYNFPRIVRPMKQNTKKNYEKNIKALTQAEIVVNATAESCTKKGKQENKKSKC